MSLLTFLVFFFLIFLSLPLDLFFLFWFRFFHGFVLPMTHLVLSKAELPEVFYIPAVPFCDSW